MEKYHSGICPGERQTGSGRHGFDRQETPTGATRRSARRLVGDRERLGGNEDQRDDQSDQRGQTPLIWRMNPLRTKGDQRGQTPLITFDQLPHGAVRHPRRMKPLWEARPAPILRGEGAASMGLVSF